MAWGSTIGRLALVLGMMLLLLPPPSARAADPCGSWDGKAPTEETRYSLKVINQGSGLDCQGAVQFGNTTKAFWLGGYTLEIQSTAKNAQYTWTPVLPIIPKTFLTPNSELVLHPQPSSISSTSSINITLDVTQASMILDLDLWMLHSLLEFLPTNCLVSPETLMYTAIRVGDVTGTAVALAIKKDTNGFIDELVHVSGDFRSRAIDILVDLGVSCAIDLGERSIGWVAHVPKIAAEYIVSVSTMTIDFFKYRAVAAHIAIEYQPDTLAANWAKMESSWGKDDEAAIAALEEIMKIDPNYREAREKLYALLVGKGDRLWASGDCDAGRSTLVRALEVNPAGTEAQQRLASYTAPPSWTLTLTADATQVPVGTQVSVTAETNRPLPDFMSVGIGFFDRDLGRLRFGNAGLCIRIDQTRCRFPMTISGPGQQTLGAVLNDNQAARANPNTPTEPLASSELLTITWGNISAARPSRIADIQLRAFDLTPRRARYDEAITASFTIANIATETISIRGLTVSLTVQPSGCSREVGFPVADDISLQPGQQYVYRANRIFGFQSGGCQLAAGPMWRDSGGQWWTIPPHRTIPFEIWGVPRAPR